MDDIVKKILKYPQFGFHGGLVCEIFVLATTVWMNTSQSYYPHDAGSELFAGFMLETTVLKNDSVNETRRCETRHGKTRHSESQQGGRQHTVVVVAFVVHSL